MSHPSEFTWSVYVDDELPPDEVRRAEMHLISCHACRGQVMALRDEIDALSNAFHERSPTHAVVQPRQAPDPDLSWGLPVAIAAVTAVLTIGGLLLDLSLPGVFDLLNPKRLIGVNEMVFDTIFLLRDRWPQLFEAAASVGAMAAFSALGCAVLHALSRHIAKSSSLSLLLLCFLVYPEDARALDFRQDQDTHIGAGETVSETLVCTGKIVTIDGTIDGDLLVGAERFTMRGKVTGNLYVIASEVEIEGVIEGTVLGIGERVSFSGRVDGSAALMGDRLTLMDEAEIGRDLALFGEGVRLAGKAGRDVTFAGDWIEVRADIARDLHVLAADRVALLDVARIGRDVRANLLGGHVEIERALEASVGGEVRVSNESIVRDHYLAHYKEPGFYMMVLVSAAAAFVFGLLIYVLDPRLFEADPPDARGFFRSAGIGFVVVLAGPVALALIALTVVGIPIALFGFFVWIVALYTSYVLVAGVVGQTVLTPSGSALGDFAPSMLVGILILSAIAALPFIGPPVRILTVLFGLGCLFDRIRGMHALNLRGFRG